MPSTALQSRISAFESLSSPATAPTRIHKSPPIATSLLETPLSPHTAASLQAVTPFTQRPSKSPSPSPPNLGRKTSLIDLKDWIVDDGPSPNGFPNAVTPTQHAFSNNPLINLESPPKHKPRPKPKPKSLVMAPPLPPRKPSYTSLKSVSSGSSPPNNPTTTFYPPRRSDSLTVEHTYPPLTVNLDARTRTNGHAPASSISSFHSVSLSSDTDPSTPGSVGNYIATFPIDHNRTGTSTGTSSEHGSTSLDESYEDVSFSSIISPSTERVMTQDWERALARGAPTKPGPPASTPPTLPKRPSPSAPGSPRIQSSTSFTSLTATTSSSMSTIKPPLPTTYAVRRTAPPPPPTSRSSDRSSILSTATSTSTRSMVAARLKRPTPVPLAARRRYEVLFNATIVQVRRADKQHQQTQEEGRRPAEARRSRQAAGWRGLSVDLITNAGVPKVDAVPNGESKREALNVQEEVVDSDRLRAEVVRVIWAMSGLEPDRLRVIWSECDINNDGSLDRDGFVKGMWRIDEELRRAQIRSSSGSSLFSSGSMRMRRPPSTGSASALRSQRARAILR